MFFSGGWESSPPPPWHDPWYYFLALRHCHSGGRLAGVKSRRRRIYVLTFICLAKHYFVSWHWRWCMPKHVCGCINMVHRCMPYSVCSTL